MNLRMFGCGVKEWWGVHGEWRVVGSGQWAVRQWAVDSGAVGSGQWAGTVRSMQHAPSRLHHAVREEEPEQQLLDEAGADGPELEEGGERLLGEEVLVGVDSDLDGRARATRRRTSKEGRG